MERREKRERTKTFMKTPSSRSRSDYYERILKCVSFIYRGRDYSDCCAVLLIMVNHGWFMNGGWVIVELYCIYTK